jgi:hypothetical protein
MRRIACDVSAMGYMRAPAMEGEFKNSVASDDQVVRVWGVSHLPSFCGPAHQQVGQGR